MIIEHVADQLNVSPTELHNICKRESLCTGRVIGIHEEDSWAAKKMYEKALQNKYIDVIDCPNYLIEDGDYERWGVRGSYGLSAAFYIRYLNDTFTCPDPELLDNFYWSTRVAGKVLAEEPSCEERVKRWVGVGKWKTLSPEIQRKKIRRQCSSKISKVKRNPVPYMHVHEPSC